jgi:hypothetical protein
MFRRIFKSLKRGEYVYRVPQKHSCWLPAGGRTGDIWKCKCGQIYKCRGLSMFADVIEWSIVGEDDVQEEN